MTGLLPLSAWRWGRGSGERQSGLRTACAPSVLGFLALAVLRSVGLMPDTLAVTLGDVASVCIAVAVVSLGAGVRAQGLC